MALHPSAPRLQLHVLVLLSAIFCLALFLAWEPLLSFPIWGSDTGEYYYLTHYLVQHGSLLLQGYSGWGFGYPYFPGMFVLSGAIAEAFGASPLFALQVVIPLTGALSLFPLFLLARKILPSDGAALVGAGIASVVFPRIFILSHPVPDTLGDLLALGSLWMFVEQRRDARWLLPLTLTVSALVVSHHLSSYFFLLSAVSILVGLEFVSPGRWSARFPLREFVFLGGFTSLLFAYWSLYAVPFRQILLEGLPFLHNHPSLAPPLELAATLFMLGILGLLVQLRRTRFSGVRSLLRPNWPTTRKIYRDGIILAVLIFGGASLLIFFPIPGTGQMAPPVDVLWFTPLLVLVPFSTGGIRLSAISRLGPSPYVWLVGLIVSVTLTAGLNVQAIPLARQAEYVVLAMSMVCAIGIGGLFARLEGSTWKSVAAAGLVVLAIGANALVAVPPPQVTDGFQEGFSHQDITEASWMAASLSHGSTLASDHRLSDLYFGLSGNPATWWTTCYLFLGNSSECPSYPGNVSQAVQSELNGSGAPTVVRPVNAVAVDGTMISVGVALDPAQYAYPMNATQLKFLQGPQFVLLYENGPQEVWWVTGS